MATVIIASRSFPARARAATRLVGASLVAVMVVAIGQVVLVGADVAGWKADARNPFTNGWGTHQERALLAADGHTPLDGLLDAPTMQVVRDLLGASDDLDAGHGWFTRSGPSGPLTTSIEPALQHALDHTVESLPAAAVVLDVTTGRIVALGGDLDTTPATAAPPGSIFKIVLYGAALNLGQINAATRFPWESAYAGVSNYRGTSCGGGLAEVIARSCNTAAERVGARLGLTALEDAATAWGFVAPEDVAGSIPAFPDPEALREEHAFTSAVIGQHDTRITPLFAATMAAAVANGGTLRAATLTDTGNDQGAPVLQPAAADTLGDAMRLAVTNGTATGADLSHLEVAAKTGTAQTGLGYDHAWTVAYAPAAEPRYAVSVLVRGDPDHSRTGGHDAAPLAAQLLDAAFRTTNTEIAQ